MSEHQSCPNPTCAQYRIQHKNMTLKRLELEKELQHIRRLQSNEFNQAVAQNAVTPMRDAVTGDMGLMMPNGEIITPDKMIKRMEMAKKCMETLQASEKHNRQLMEENRILKQGNETTYNEMRRLERVLNGFEKTRRYDNFTEEKYKEAVKLNDELAEQIENTEYEMHILEEENAILKQQQHRQCATAARTVIADDEDRASISSYITSDGRIPIQCPCDPEGCAERYEAQVIGNQDPVDAFALHMNKMHKVVAFFKCLFLKCLFLSSQCIHCKELIKGSKTLHEQACALKTMRKIPKKKRPLLDDE